MSSPRNWKQDPRLNDHGYLWELMSPSELADEVMELRAKVQVQEIALNMYKQTTDDQQKRIELLTADRDHYKREAEFWERNCPPDE